MNSVKTEDAIDFIKDKLSMDIDDIRQLQGIDKKIAIRLHQKEVEKKRVMDKKEARKEAMRIYNKKSHIKRKEAKKNGRTDANTLVK